MLLYPDALLLDFGGVIADAPGGRDAPQILIDRIHTMVGGEVSPERIEEDLRNGSRRYAVWRNDVSARDRPIEMTHRQVWDEFVMPKWPERARVTVLSEVSSLSKEWARRPNWALRPGIRELLCTATDAKIPVGIVSNTLCGEAHRDYLDEVGIIDRFSAQVYSDEAGVRKPNPELAWRAAQELGVAIESCWFVGDSVIRDMVCARRAGVGVAILMRSPRTLRDPEVEGIEPDVVVDDGFGVCTLLRQAAEG